MAAALPLEGVAVAELGGRVAVGACGSLLAQLGAEVRLVEEDAPEGDKWRHRACFAAGKKSVAPGGGLDDLLAAADVVITSSDVDGGAPEIPAGAIHIDVTAFGANGPMAGKPYSEALVQALSGITDTTGFPGGPPVPIDAYLIEFLAAAYAAAAAIAALRVRRLGGPDQSAEIALFDCAFNTLTSHLPNYFVGESNERLGNSHPLVSPWNTYPTKDGYILICIVSMRNWQTFCEAIGRPELADDPDFGDQKKRIARRDEIDRLVADWTGGLSLDECLAVLSEARLPGGPIVTIAEAADEPNIRYRGMIERLADPISGQEVQVPASPIRSNAWRGLAPDAIPVPGSGEVPAAGASGENASGNSIDAALPLAGIRVIETGQYTTAPHAGRNLAMLGAEVIKIEPLGGDETRGWLPGRDGVGYYFCLTNSGKQPIQLDLRSDEGKAVLGELVAGADVLLENMKPGSLARLGFAWDELKRLNPRLIYCAISGFGHDSVYEGRAAVDTVVQATSGLMDMTRVDDVPLKSCISYSDFLGGQFALLSILAGLEHLARHGEAQAFDISMQDATLWITQTAWNAGDDAKPPARVVACADGYVTVDDAGELPANAAALSRDELVERFTAGGIAAAPVLTVAEAAEHPQTASRELILLRPGPGEELWPSLGSPIRFSATPAVVGRAIAEAVPPTPANLEALGLKPRDIRSAD